MNLRDLSEAIAGHAANLHPLTDTNVDSLTAEGGDLIAVCDTSALQEEIDDLKTGEEWLNTQVKELSEENSSLELRAELAERLIDEVKWEDAPGATLRTYRDRAINAEAEVALAREGIRRAHDERAALRKRKGVTTNLFACERDILHLIGQIENYPDDIARWRPLAKTILEKVYAG